MERLADKHVVPKLMGPSPRVPAAGSTGSVFTHPGFVGCSTWRSALGGAAGGSCGVHAGCQHPRWAPASGPPSSCCCLDSSLPHPDSRPLPPWGTGTGGGPGERRREGYRTGETASRTLSSKAVACAWTVCYRNLPVGSLPSRLLAMANISTVSDTSPPPGRLCDSGPKGSAGVRHGVCWAEREEVRTPIPFTEGWVGGGANGQGYCPSRPEPAIRDPGSRPKGESLLLCWPQLLILPNGEQPSRSTASRPSLETAEDVRRHRQAPHFTTPPPTSSLLSHQKDLFRWGAAGP